MRFCAYARCGGDLSPTRGRQTRSNTIVTRSESQVSCVMKPERHGIRREWERRSSCVQTLISEGRPGVDPPPPRVGKGAQAVFPLVKIVFLENIMFNFSGNVASHQA